MKKTVLILLTVMIFFTGCNHNVKIDGRYYSQYGILNEDVAKNPDIEYQVNTQNAIVSFLFSWTIIVPFYLAGFYLYEPKEMKETIFSIKSDKGLIKDD